MIAFGPFRCVVPVSHLPGWPAGQQLQRESEGRMRHDANRHNPVRRRLRVLRAILVTALAACGGPPEGCSGDPTDVPSLEEARGVTDASPRQLALKVGQTADVLAVTTVPGAIPVVGSRNPGVATAQVTGTSANGTSGRATIRVTGVAEGQTVIELLGPSDPAGTPPITIDVTVTPVVRMVEVAPTFMALAPGETRKLACTVTIDGVPAQNPQVSFVSSNTTVAEVAADGTITALAEGDAFIVCSLPTGENASAMVQVRAPVTPVVPPLSQLPGSYGLTASKKSDTCPAGLFPATISNPGNIVVQVIGTGQNPPVSIGSTANVIGLYDALTGAFEGSGSTTVTVNGVVYSLIEQITGMWSRTMTSSGQTEIRLQAKLAYNATPSGGTACSVEYDALYLRSF
jgi:hypothetical protein